ncbi:MAG: UPF0158 family protein [Pseudomonadota bacterium]
MYPLTLDLQRLEAALLGSEASEHYLDLDSGALLTVAPGEPAPGVLEKYQVQTDRYLIIEPLSTAQRLAMAEAFLFSLHDPCAHAALSQALVGRKPLRSFLNALELWPALQQAWLAHQDQQIQELALDWLEDNGLEAVVRRR